MQHLDTIKTVTIGTVGAAASVGVQQAEAIANIDLPQTMSVLTQIVILISTLFGLFRKNKKISNSKN